MIAQMGVRLRVAAGAGLVGGVLLLLALSAPNHGRTAFVAAQATPAAALPAVPRPDECLVAPRPQPLFPGTPEPNAAAPSPAPLASPTPFAVPAGEPADAATVEAITATVREAVACRNAGDFARAYALFTDRLLRQLFGGPDTIDPEIRLALAEPPDRLPRLRRLTLLAVSDVGVLPDGRVGALVATATAEATFVDYLLFVRLGDRWLIDEAIAVPVAGATPPA